MPPIPSPSPDPQRYLLEAANIRRKSEATPDGKVRQEFLDIARQYEDLAQPAPQSITEVALP